MGVGNLKGLLLPMAKEALEKSMMVAKFFCVLHITSTYICYPALTEGPSMLPTLSLTGDLLLVDKISPRLGKVGSGDIVLVRSPENPRKIVAKRVKGMEGDTITYLADPDKNNRSQTLVVPKGHLWIEGDNLYASKDSRMFGAVPYGLIHGKVIWRLWPSRGFGSIN